MYCNTGIVKHFKICSIILDIGSIRYLQWNAEKSISGKPCISMLRPIWLKVPSQQRELVASLYGTLSKKIIWTTNSFRSLANNDVFYPHHFSYKATLKLGAWQAERCQPASFYYPFLYILKCSASPIDGMLVRGTYCCTKLSKRSGKPEETGGLYQNIGAMAV